MHDMSDCSVISVVCAEPPEYISFNSLRPRQNGRHFADDIFKCIFLNENVWIRIKISLKCVSKGPINNIPALIQIMALRRPGDKPLSEPMMVSLPTHICVARPQWVKLTHQNDLTVLVQMKLLINILISFQASFFISQRGMILYIYYFSQMEWSKFWYLIEFPSNLMLEGFSRTSRYLL